MIVEGSLPGFFAELGCAVTQVPPEDPSGKREAADRAREHIRTWINQPYIGPLCCAAFCLDYLQSVGAERDAGQLANALARSPEVMKTEDPRTLPVYRAIASVKAEQGAIREAEFWFGMAQIVAEDMARIVQRKFRQASWRESCMNVATTMINRVALARREKNLSLALERSKTAESWARAGGHMNSVGRLSVNRADLARQEGDYEKALSISRSARRYGEWVGDPLTISEALMLEAEILHQLAEFDRARETIEQARQVSNILNNQNITVQLNILDVILYISRNGEDNAFRRLQGLIAELETSGAPQLADQVRCTMVRELAHSPDHRDSVLEAAHTAARNQRERDDRGRSVIPGGPFLPAAVLQSLAKGIATGGLVGLPIGLRTVARTEGIRYQLAMAEYRRDDEQIAALFKSLLRDIGTDVPPDRNADLVEALLRSATRCDRIDDVVFALLSLTRSHIAPEDPKPLIDRLGAACGTASGENKLSLNARLARLNLNGNKAKAVEHFVEAIHLHKDVCNDFDYTDVDDDLAMVVARSSVVPPAHEPMDSPSLVAHAAFHAVNSAALGLCGDTAVIQRDLDHSYIEWLLRNARTASDHEYIAVLLGQGKHRDAAIRSIRAAIDSHASAGRTTLALGCRMRLVDLLVWDDQREAAIRELESLIESFRQVHGKWRARSLWRLAALYHQAQRWNEAEAAAQRCMEHYTDVPPEIFTAKAAWVLSHTQLVLKKIESSVRSAFWARELLSHFDDSETRDMRQWTDDFLHGLESFV